MEELKALSERYEKLSIEHALVTYSSSSVSQLEKENFELKARLDELSSKYNVLQANYVHLKCSHDEVVESSIMLEVAHEVVITSVKFSQSLTHSLTSTPSQLNISCTNECAPQASQSSIELNLIENIELKEEVQRLKKNVIRLKGKEKAQPSQDNRDNMVKKLEKGSNLASSKAQQKNHISSKANTTKSKKHGKRMCYGCGLYGHELAMCPHKSWADKVEAANQKASTKKCPMYKEARKEAQVATRRCYGCNEMGHKVDRCPYKQIKHRAHKGRICYACRRKGHLSYECPNGKTPKPNTFVYNDMLRKTTNGVSTSKVMCSPQTNAKAIWVPKHLLTNSKGPNKSWVPKCA